MMIKELMNILWGLPENTPLLVVSGRSGARMVDGRLLLGGCDEVTTMGPIEKDLEDLNDVTNILRKLSNKKAIVAWIAEWSEVNNDLSRDAWPAIMGIQIKTNDCEGDLLQIWVEKEIFANGRMIRISQQVF